MPKTIVPPPTQGRFTLPAEAGLDQVVIELAKKWGADAIRDSDGTVLSPEITKLGYEVYSTLCLIRADQEWAKAHRDELQQKYLMSDPRMAEGDTLTIEIMRSYSDEMYEPDTVHAPKKYWEVIDRSSGDVVPPADWDYDAKTRQVTIRKTQPWHLYTVNFLVYQIWETTSMYNHITNHWTGEHKLGLDPRPAATRKRLIEYLDQWLAEHPDTDVVRFTSMAYQFPIIHDEQHQTRFQDWCAYLDCISAVALDQFEQAKGYRLRPEDLVDGGYYNGTSRVPSQQYLDWIDFVHEFMVGFTKECVEHVHRAGKKAMMFFCDHWIGTEPYSPLFQETGMDGLINPVINGVEMRRNADVPWPNMERELRLYPYFFPVNLNGDPSFQPGGDPLTECRAYWMLVRRAILRRCVDRIGFGGYLSLVIKFPEFVDYVAHLSDEFRQIVELSKKTPAYAPSRKVAVLDAWGKRRSWMHDENWPGGWLFESLSGLPVEVEFISFSDILEHGIPSDIGVIINAGVANTSWSGGRFWGDEKVTSLLREFVQRGGGLIGVQEPTAFEAQGRLFQLSDVLGVQREVGLSRSVRKTLKPAVKKEHFILEEQPAPLDLGRLMDGIYVTAPTTEVLAKQENLIALTANTFGKGRAVYLAGFKLSPENSHLLLRAILWAGSMEAEAHRWYTTNPHTECAAYPQAGNFVVINNDKDPQTTTLYDGNGKETPVTLEPFESRWFEM